MLRILILFLNFPRMKDLQSHISCFWFVLLLSLSITLARFRFTMCSDQLSLFERGGK